MTTNATTGVATAIFQAGVNGVTNGFTVSNDSSNNMSYSFLNGNVGIGTTAPVAKLDLRDTINRSIQITPSVDNTASGVSKIEFRHNDNGNVNALYASIQAPLINGGLGFNAGELAFFTAPQTAGNPAALERLRISNAGNVGIGTTSPDSIIHAYKNFTGFGTLSAGHIQGIDSGPTNTDVYFLQKGAVGGFADYGLINAVAGGNSKFYVRGDGNVGIGTATPTAKLEVAGNVQLSGGGTIVQEAWITPSYLNGWLDYATSGDTNWGPTAYYKGTDGRVYLRGLARAGTCGTAIFNLPAGYRPAKYRTFSSVSMDLFVRVNIAPNGDVIAVAGCNNSWVSLDGISFRVVGD